MKQSAIKTATLSLTLITLFASFVTEQSFARGRKNPNPISGAPSNGSGKAPRENGAYPTGPDDTMTPGALCANASEYRYPEKIKYCSRDVEGSLKDQIIRLYDQRLGYHIQQMDRQDFKIDHLIPLCAGGSNEQANLWPQHKSVYVKTDRIEETLCLLMAAGKLSQDEAVRLVLDVKHHLEKADGLLNNLLNQLGNRGSSRNPR